MHICLQRFTILGYKKTPHIFLYYLKGTDNDT